MAKTSKPGVSVFFCASRSREVFTSFEDAADYLNCDVMTLKKGRKNLPQLLYVGGRPVLIGYVDTDFTSIVPVVSVNHLAYDIVRNRGNSRIVTSDTRLKMIRSFLPPALYAGVGDRIKKGELVFPLPNKDMLYVRPIGVDRQYPFAIKPRK